MYDDKIKSLIRWNENAFENSSVFSIYIFPCGNKVISLYELASPPSTFHYNPLPTVKM